MTLVRISRTGLSQMKLKRSLACAFLARTFCPRQPISCVEVSKLGTICVAFELSFYSLLYSIDIGRKSMKESGATLSSRLTRGVRCAFRGSRSPQVLGTTSVRSIEAFATPLTVAIGGESDHRSTLSLLRCAWRIAFYVGGFRRVALPGRTSRWALGGAKDTIAPCAGAT